MEPTTAATVAILLVTSNFLFGIISLAILKNMYKQSAITLGDLVTFILAGGLGTFVLLVWIIMRRLDRVVLIKGKKIID